LIINGARRFGSASQVTECIFLTMSGVWPDWLEDVLEMGSDVLFFAFVLELYFLLFETFAAK
jgi:hypothetical protein